MKSSPTPEVLAESLLTNLANVVREAHRFGRVVVMANGLQVAEVVPVGPTQISGDVWQECYASAHVDRGFA